MIKNIIFDMGGVLIDYNPEKTAYEYFDKVTAENVLKYALRSKLWAEKDRGVVEPDEIFSQVEPHVDSKHHAFLKDMLYNFYQFMPEFPEMAGIIKKIKEQGFSVYLLSNAGPDFYEHSGYIKAFDYFDGFLVSQDYKVIKPEKEIYEMLFKKFSLKPEECFFFDDVQKNIDGGIACGMQGMQFSHNDLPAFIAKLNEIGVTV